MFRRVSEAIRRKRERELRRMLRQEAVYKRFLRIHGYNYHNSSVVSSRLSETEECLRSLRKDGHA